MKTSSVDTEKCWHQGPGLELQQGFQLLDLGSRGRRSFLYWSMASLMDCVMSVLSSVVATGKPLTNSTMSKLFSLCSE